MRLGTGQQIVIGGGQQKTADGACQSRGRSNLSARITAGGNDRGRQIRRMLTDTGILLAGRLEKKCPREENF